MAGYAVSSNGNVPLAPFLAKGREPAYPVLRSYQKVLGVVVGLGPGIHAAAKATVGMSLKWDKKSATSCCAEQRMAGPSPAMTISCL